MRQVGSAEEPMRILSPHACRCTCWEGGEGYTFEAHAVLRVHVRDRSCRTDSTIAVHDHVPYRGVVLCVSVALERGWRGWNAHGGYVPVHSNCVYTSYEQ